MSQVTKLLYNGLELGEVDSGYGISQLKGFAAPPISTSEQQKADKDGSNIFAQKYNSRVMTFKVEVMGLNSDDYLARAREFIRKYKINVDDFLVVTMWNGQLRKIKAKVTDGPETTYDPDNITMNSFKLEMTAENPFFLDNITKNFSVGLPVSGGFPIAGPLPFPLGAPTGGQFTINNAGDVGGFAEFIIRGPVQNPTVRNATTGQSFQIFNTIPAGQYVRVFRDQQGVFVYLNGVTNWRRYLKRDLFEIVPGNNLIKWNATVFEADAILEATFNDPLLSP